MKHPPVIRLSLVLLSGLALALLIYPLTAGAVDSPPDPLRGVWDRVHEVGSRGPSPA